MHLHTQTKSKTQKDTSNKPQKDKGEATKKEGKRERSQLKVVILTLTISRGYRGKGRQGKKEKTIADKATTITALLLLAALKPILQNLPTAKRSCV